MSLPYPTTTTSKQHLIHPSEQEAWDAPLIALAQKSNGDLRQLLYAFFSFLHRRTDFYAINDGNSSSAQGGSDSNNPNMGFKEGDAEKIIIAAFRQFPLRRMKKQESSNSSSSNNDSMEKSKKKISSTSTSTQNLTTTKSDGKNLQEDEQLKKSSSISPKKDNDKPKVEKKSTSKIRYTKEGKQIPIGNGGIVKSFPSSQHDYYYEWTQTLDETSIIIPIPLKEHTSSKDLDIKIQPSYLSIKHKKDSTALNINGKLTNTIKVDESTWSLENNVLLITLDKCVKKWWNKVLVEENEEIDTTLVDSRTKISDYDNATQGAIRKIMFDQKQERLGLPTSNEILHEKKYNELEHANKKTPLPAGVEYIDSEKMKEIHK